MERAGRIEGQRWVCLICEYVYHEALGLPQAAIPPGTRWEDVPADFRCPQCGIGKQDFERAQD
jgi:rubredoxin